MSDSTIKLKNVRLSFPKIFNPESYNGGQAKYSASFLIDPTTKEGKENMAAVEKAIEFVLDEKFGKGKHPKIKPDHKCYEDGNERDYDGYADMMVISSSEKRPPLLLDRDKTPLNEAQAMADNKLYAGCYVNAVVNLWAYNTKTEEGMPAKGFSANLRAIQFKAHGEEFSGVAPIDPDEWFDEEPEEDGDIDL